MNGSLLLKTVRVVVVVALVGMCLHSSAWAAGYAILEQSVTGLGNAYVGAAAGSHGLSSAFFNPATLTRTQGRHASLGATYLGMKSTFALKSATNRFTQVMPGTALGDNIARPAVIPTLYAVQDLRGPWQFGLAVNVPWGLESVNPDGWVGRYHALESRMQSLNINPMVALKVGPELSVGFGVQAQRVSAHLTNAVDFGGIARAFGNPAGNPGYQDGMSTVDGDDWGYGYTLGLLWEPDTRNRVGVGFRSRVVHELTGSANFTYGPSNVGQALALQSGKFVPTGAKADIITPYVLSMGLDHQLDQRWNLMLEARRTGWSSFDEMRVRFDNPVQGDSVTDEKWHDSWSYGLGASYKACQHWTWRVGLCREESPIPTQYRTPRIPDSDRSWYAFGASYQPRKGLRWDFGFSHLTFDNAPIALALADTGNEFRGQLEGDFTTSINLIGVQVESEF